MNVPADERTQAGQGDEHPALQGAYQHHEGNARDRHRGDHHRSRRGEEGRDHDPDFEPTALVQVSIRGRTEERAGGSQPGSLSHECASTSTTTTEATSGGDEQTTPRTRPATTRSRSPTSWGNSRRGKPNKRQALCAEPEVKRRSYSRPFPLRPRRPQNMPRMPKTWEDNIGLTTRRRPWTSSPRL